MPVDTPKERVDSAVSISTSTPPRSPIKGISPVREAPVEVEIPRELTEAELKQKRDSRRKAVESIRIYADSDVFALLADVEDEINRMGDHSTDHSTDRSTPPEVASRREKKISKQPQRLPVPRKEESASQLSDSQFSSSAPMSPFLLKPAVFTMPSGKQGVKA